MRALVRKALSQERRSAIGWGLGLLAIAVMYSAFYPSIKESASTFSGYLDQLPEAVRGLIGDDFTTPAGYLRAETFSLLGPLLFLMFAIGTGARSIGGEDEAGTLEILLSLPVRRREVLLARMVTTALLTGALASVLGIALIVVGPVFEVDVPPGQILSAAAMLWLVGMAFGAIATAIGAATGRRSTAVAATGAIAAAAYILNVFAPTVEVLRPLRFLSPFRWYLDPDPLVAGLRIANVAVLLGIAAAATLFGLLAFERRDVG